MIQDLSNPSVHKFGAAPYTSSDPFPIPPGTEKSGTPRIFISHGTKDQILPIDQCSRRLVPILHQSSYDVQYHEFDGPHTVPPDIARQAVDWLLSA